MEENKKLKGNVNKNQTALLEQAKKNAAIETDAANVPIRKPTSLVTLMLC